MKVLWVLSTPTEHIGNILYDDKSKKASGFWIDNTLKLVKKELDIEVVVVCVSNKKFVDSKSDEFAEYENIYIRKAKVGNKRNISKQNIDKAKTLIEKHKPDVIHIWGSETPIGLIFKKAAGNIPCVVTIQGLMSSICKYKNGLLTIKEMTKGSIINLLKMIPFSSIARMYNRQAGIERQLLNEAKFIISESDWAFSYLDTLEQKCKEYILPLQINNEFYNNTWKIESCIKGRVFCVAGRGAYKGTHQAIKAISIVKKYCPYVQIVIPGKAINVNASITERIFETPYIFYLRKLIKENNLNNNVVFLETLTQHQMIEEMKKANMFILPSVIENQSATLREAMSIGLPVIATDVGCVNDVVLHKKTGYIYRYEEQELLARYIINIIRNDQLAVEMGKNAKETMHKNYSQFNTAETLMKIYNDMLSA